MFESFDCLGKAEELSVLVDFALEVRDQEEGDNAQDCNNNTKEDDHSLNACSNTKRVGKCSNDSCINKTNDKTGYTINRVANADLGCILFFFAAQTNNLEAGAPPYKDGGYAHCNEERQANAYRRKRCVDKYQNCRCEEACRSQGAHAELVCNDTGRQVTNHCGQAVCGNHHAEVRIGASESLHQRIVENVLKIHRRIDNRRSHRDQNYQCPLVQGRDVFICHLTHAFSHNCHCGSFLLAITPMESFVRSIPMSLLDEAFRHFFFSIADTWIIEKNMNTFIAKAA